MELAQTDRQLAENSTGGKLFAEIKLPLTTKQYKNDNIVNFV